MTNFKHPFLQSWGMFLGEALCLCAFYVLKCIRARNGGQDPEMALPEDQRPKPFNTFVLLPPVHYSFFDWFS